MEFRVISIAGYARSGTTFLGKVFNYYQDALFVGEIDQGIRRYMTQPSFVTKICSCNEPFSQCSLWTKVFAELAHYFEMYKYDELIEMDEFLLDLYGTIHRISGARFIIDSSKEIPHVRRVKELYRDDHFLIYIIRDPRAIIHSRNKTRVNLINKGHHPNPSMAKRRNLLSFYDSFEWVYLNNKMYRAYHKLPQTLFTVYESWHGNFEQKFQEFARFVGLQLQEGYTDPHILMGNINRYQTRDIKFRCDLSWKTSMNTFRKTVVSLITYPYIKLRRLNFNTRRNLKV